MEAGDSVVVCIDPRHDDDASLAFSIERISALSPSSVLVILSSPGFGDDDASLNPAFPDDYFVLDTDRVGARRVTNSSGSGGGDDDAAVFPGRGEATRYLSADVGASPFARLLRDLAQVHALFAAAGCPATVFACPPTTIEAAVTCCASFGADAVLVPGPESRHTGTHSRLVNALSAGCRALGTHTPPSFAVEGFDTPEPRFLSAPRRAPYSCVVLGGTFDRLHAGHAALLTAAACLARDTIVIGISTGALIEKKEHAELIEPFEARAEAVERFVDTVVPGLDVVTVAIEDPFGPSVVDERIDAIVVSRETEKGGDLVSEERIRRGLNAVDVCVVDCVEDSDDSTEKISSSSIRKRIYERMLAEKL